MHVRLATEDPLALGVEEALGDELRDGATRGERRVQAQPRVWPLDALGELRLDEGRDPRVADGHEPGREGAVVRDDLLVNLEDVQPPPPRRSESPYRSPSSSKALRASVTGSAGRPSSPRLGPVLLAGRRHPTRRPAVVVRRPGRRPTSRPVTIGGLSERRSAGWPSSSSPRNYRSAGSTSSKSRPERQTWQPRSDSRSAQSSPQHGYTTSAMRRRSSSADSIRSTARATYVTMAGRPRSTTSLPTTPAPASRPASEGSPMSWPTSSSTSPA